MQGSQVKNFVLNIYQVYQNKNSDNYASVDAEKLVLEGGDAEASEKTSLIVQEEVDQQWRTKVIISNWVSYLAMIILSFTAQGFSSATLREISTEWSTIVSAAGWAFSIWAIIYLLELALLVYHTLPAEKVPNRSDNLIFNEIKLLWTINLIATGAWLPIFMTNTKGGFIIGQILIVIQLTLLLMIMKIIDTHTPKLNWTEFILIRVTFSLYAGWVTAATIIGFFILLKTWGASDPLTKSKRAWDFAGWLMFMDEEAWGCVIICVALVFYSVWSWRYQNPMYGAVLIWASGAILTQLNKTRPEAKAMITTTTTVIILQSCSMAGLIGYIVWQNNKKAQSTFTQ